MEILSAKEMDQLFERGAFHEYLKGFLSGDAQMPQRVHHDFHGNTLLLMPAWNQYFCGVKIAAVAPGNSEIGKPVVHAVYTLFDTKTGEPLLQLDGQRLTALRTAAASALAARHLARPDSKRLLILGAGALCPELIAAHAFELPIAEVAIWNRNLAKAESFCQQGTFHSLRVKAVNNLDEAVGKAEIISCATPAIKPILKGQWVKKGTHIDLVGSYRPDMREADDDLIRKADLWLDNPAARMESGDVKIPLETGAMTDDRIKGTLREVLEGSCEIRSSSSQITVFKSVGFALEDLAAASWFFAKKNENT